MNYEGPQLDALLHRLAECPSEFLAASTDHSAASSDDSVRLVAIVCDLLRKFSPSSPPERNATLLSSLRGRTPAAASLTGIVCWLLDDPWFTSLPDANGAMVTFLNRPILNELSQLVRPDRFVNDPDRREELVRLCLAHLELRPLGETIAQAADRLTTLDSRERDRVLRETAAAEKRAREIREAMALKRAQEAASRYGE